MSTYRLPIDCRIGETWHSAGDLVEGLSPGAMRRIETAARLIADTTPPPEIAPPAAAPTPDTLTETTEVDHAA